MHPFAIFTTFIGFVAAQTTTFSTSTTSTSSTSTASATAEVADSPFAFFASIFNSTDCESNGYAYLTGGCKNHHIPKGGSVKLQLGDVVVGYSRPNCAGVVVVITTAADNLTCQRDLPSAVYSWNNVLP